MSDARSLRLVVERVAEIAPATRSFLLRLPAGRGLSFRPGQFLSLALPVAEKPIVRAYSIASFPEDGECLEICLDRVPGGPGSEYLFGLAEGAEIEGSGPWGTFVVGEPPPPLCVFVGQGTGVAPMRPMVRAALQRAEVRRVDLLQAATSSSLLLFQDELRAWAGDDPRLSYEVLVEGDDDPTHERLYARVEELHVEGTARREADFFLCGVGPIVTRLRDLLRGAGYQRRSVHYEKW